MLNRKVPEKISKHEFDFGEIEKMIEEEMEKQNVKNKIQKVILSLQNIKGRDYLICTVFISMLGILKVKIDLSTKEITEFEQKSFFDIMSLYSGTTEILYQLSNSFVVIFSPLTMAITSSCKFFVSIL